MHLAAGKVRVLVVAHPDRVGCSSSGDGGGADVSTADGVSQSHPGGLVGAVWIAQWWLLHVTDNVALVSQRNESLAKLPMLIVMSGVVVKEKLKGTSSTRDEEERMVD